METWAIIDAENGSPTGTGRGFVLLAWSRAVLGEALESSITWVGDRRERYSATTCEVQGPLNGVLRPLCKRGDVKSEAGWSGVKAMKIVGDDKAFEGGSLWGLRWSV
jgi:hypothetical protein